MSKAGVSMVNNNELFDGATRNIGLMIGRMCETMEVDDIATILGVKTEVVNAHLKDKGMKFWLVCNRTGRRFQARTQRGLYRIACLQGLTDWDWGCGDKPAQ